MKRGQQKRGTQTKVTRQVAPKRRLERSQKEQIKRGTFDYAKWHDLYRH